MYHRTVNMKCSGLISHCNNQIINKKSLKDLWGDPDEGADFHAGYQWSYKFLSADGKDFFEVYDCHDRWRIGGTTSDNFKVFANWLAEQFNCPVTQLELWLDNPLHGAGFLQ